MNTKLCLRQAVAHIRSAAHRPPHPLVPSGWFGVESSAELGATRQLGWRVALMLTAPLSIPPRKPQPEPKREKEAKKPTIKKPLNAFMLYMKEMRAKVIAECTLKESAAINQILGRRVRACGARCHRPSAASPSLTAALKHVTSTCFQTRVLLSLKCAESDVPQSGAAVVGTGWEG